MPLLHIFLFLNAAFATPDMCPYFKIEMQPSLASDTEPFKALKALQEIQGNHSLQHYQVFTRETEPRILIFIINPLNNLSPASDRKRLQEHLKQLGKFKELTTHCSSGPEYEKYMSGPALLKDQNTKNEDKALAALKPTPAEIKLIKCSTSMLVIYGDSSGKTKVISKDNFREILKALSQTPAISTKFDIHISSEGHILILNLNSVSTQRSSSSDKELILLSRTLAKFFLSPLTCNKPIPAMRPGK